MTNFIDAEGNLLEVNVDALVNTVNTIGIMGKGIALQFKNAFPANFKAYAKACKANEVELGKMFVFDNGQLTNPRWIVNFPTKGHWRSKSRLVDVESGLDDLRLTIAELGVTSIAVPPVGCGNGGLNWADIYPLILAKLDGLNIDVHIYGPAGAPAAQDMTVSTPRPPLTPGKAALIAIVDGYSKLALGASLIEIQKLMYFLQEAGEPLKLRYKEERYGPYADNLRHVLKAVEGHYLEGFGDGSLSVYEAESIRVLDTAADEAMVILADSLTVKHTRSVLDLVVGYESAYGLELLATVHWVATKNDDINDLNSVITRVQDWSRRKERMFTTDHIETAWRHLKAKGWFTPVLVPM